jgi:hypothetical protein
MGRRGNGEGSIQRPSLRRRWILQYPFSPCLQHVPEALCGDSQGSGGDSRETPVQGCLQGNCENRRERAEATHRKVHLAGPAIEAHWRLTDPFKAY